MAVLQNLINTNVLPNKYVITSRKANFCHKSPTNIVRTKLSVRSMTNDKRGSSEKEILDAFFIGKALADTVSEKLGSALGEIISQFSQQQAEQREFIQKFQEEVEERAQTSLLKAAKLSKTENNYPVEDSTNSDNSNGSSA